MDQARLIGIENDREITAVSDPQFWYLFQRSVLLALKEESVLNETQYRYAEEKLKRQCG